MTKKFESQAITSSDEFGIPPHDIDAERAVLAVMLNDKVVCNDLVHRLDVGHFYSGAHQKIFEAAFDLSQAGVPVDAITISDQLAARDDLDECGGCSEILALKGSYLSSENVEYHLGIVERKAEQRRCIGLGFELQRISYNGFDTKKLSEIRTALNEIKSFGASNVYFSQCKTLADALSPREKILSIVEKIAPVASVILWYGAPGHLKSNLVFDMAFSVASGYSWLSGLPGKGECAGFAVSKSPVLWVDVDNGEDVICERLAAFARARGVVDVPFFWISFPTPALSAAQGLENLIACAKKIKPGLMVFDNLLRIAGVRDENSSEMDAAMFNLRLLAEKSRASIQVIHHRNKRLENGRDGNSIRGHSSIEAGIDNAFLVQREDNSDIVTVKNVKSRRRPVDLFSALWTYENDDDGETLKTARFFGTEMQDTKIEVRAKLKAKIFEELAVCPVNFRALQNAVGGRSENLRDALTDLQKEGKVKMEEGKRRAHIYSRSV